MGSELWELRGVVCFYPVFLLKVFLGDSFMFFFGVVLLWWF